MSALSGHAARERPTRPDLLRAAGSETLRAGPVASPGSDTGPPPPTRSPASDPRRIMTRTIASGPASAGSQPASDTTGAPKPILDGLRPRGHSALVYMFTVVPSLALVAAVPLAWGWGLGWVDVGLAVGFYLVSALGVTVGFHRYFTHRAFKANRPLRNALAIAGSLAVQGDVDHLGRRPPPPPRLRRQGRRPALALAVRHRAASRWPGASGTPTSGGCSGATAPTPPGSPPTCSPTPTSPGSAGSSRCGRRSACSPRPSSAV